MKTATPTLKQLRHGIKRQNFVPLPFPLSYKELSGAAESFFDFLRLPSQTKKQFYATVIPDDDNSMVGYMLRHKGMDGDEMRDEKEYFHYNRYAEAHFERLIQGMDSNVARFFAHARTIYEAAERAMEEIIREFETEYSGLYQQFFPGDRPPHFYLRFLKYNVMGKGEFLACGHYDYGAYTLALAESAPGLRIGLNEEKLKPVKHKDKHAVFMPGHQLHMLTSPEFTPAWHDVVQKIEDTHSDEAARWSIVFFADPVKKAETTWEERHRPLY